jgi:hypothetical protein
MAARHLAIIVLKFMEARDWRRLGEKTRWSILFIQVLLFGWLANLGD